MREVFCPTIRHVEDLLKNVNVMIQPKVIFIHTGTNHLDEPDFNIDNLENDVDMIIQDVDMIFKLKQLCPRSEIIVSSVLPRKELSLPLTNFWWQYILIS